MSFREKMMDSMMGKMSKEDKSKMMENMMGGDGMPSMMNMMKGMMGSSKSDNGDEFNPMDMCKKMMQTYSQSNEMAEFATPELRRLFEEWLQLINEEILHFLKDEDSIDPKIIAKKFNLSEESVNYILGKLAQQGKLKLNPK